MKNTVCHGCEDRKVGCHATCPRFLRECEEREAWKRERNAKRDSEWDQTKLALRRVNMVRKNRRPK